MGQRWPPLRHTSYVIRHCTGTTVGQTLLINGSAPDTFTLSGLKLLRAEGILHVAKIFRSHTTLWEYAKTRRDLQQSPAVQMWQLECGAHAMPLTHARWLLRRATGVQGTLTSNIITCHVKTNIYIFTAYVTTCLCPSTLYHGFMFI